MGDKPTWLQEEAPSETISRQPTPGVRGNEQFSPAVKDNHRELVHLHQHGLVYITNSDKLVIGNHCATVCIDLLLALSRTIRDSRRLLTDNGLQFMRKLFMTLCRLLGVVQLWTEANHL